MTRPLVIGELFAGIGGMSVAAHALGWRTAWVSEIDPFACAVLAHHFPDAPNLGDVTKIDWNAVDSGVNPSYPPENGIYSEEEQPVADQLRKIPLNAIPTAIEMYDRGLSLADVAAFYGVTRQALWMLFKRRGVPMRDQQRHGEDNHFHRGTAADQEAHDLTERAVEKGILVRPTHCEACGKVPKPFKDGRTAIQAHHDDYNKPLAVRWLCQRCHHAWHKTNTAIPRVKEALEPARIDILCAGFP